MSEGFISLSRRFIIAWPESIQSFCLSSEVASWLLLPGKLIPSASIADAIVFAVYIPPHEPGPLTEIFSTWIKSDSSNSPFENSPVFSQTVT